jgi:ankyrin repeat protein
MFFMPQRKKKRDQAAAPGGPQPGDLLCQAVRQNDLREVQRLLAAGVDANAPATDFAHGCALMWVRDVAIADALLAAGADVQRQDDYGFDVLAYVLDSGNDALIARLLQAGADLNQRNKYGWTRLRAAAFGRNPEAVAQLLKLGADPALDRGKLLSAASWYGSAGYSAATERTIDLLVAAGEDVNAADAHGYTALHCAVHGYAHTPSDEEWWNASSDGADETATRVLLRHGADPNAAGTNGMTPLLLAVQSSYGAEPCLEALVAAGAEVDKPGHLGITPLMAAAAYGMAENLRLLLAHGADATRADHFGHDAGYYARQYLAHLRAEAEEEGSTGAADEESHAWRRKREENAQRCLALLGAT